MTLVRQYEQLLRDFIDDAMAVAFGENWIEERLPLCDCRDLLRKWHKRGGDVFDHADFAHYERIMTHEEHFEVAFARGFEELDDLRRLLEAARNLRARSHHPHEFTAEDMRDLRVTWRMIERGLLALSDDYELVFGEN